MKKYLTGLRLFWVSALSLLPAILQAHPDHPGEPQPPLIHFHSTGEAAFFIGICIVSIAALVIRGRLRKQTV